MFVSLVDWCNFVIKVKDIKQKRWCGWSAWTTRPSATPLCADASWCAGLYWAWSKKIWEKQSAVLFRKPKSKSAAQTVLGPVAYINFDYSGCIYSLFFLKHAKRPSNRWCVRNGGAFRECSIQFYDQYHGVPRNTRFGPCLLLNRCPWSQ